MRDRFPELAAALAATSDRWIDEVELERFRLLLDYARPLDATHHENGFFKTTLWTSPDDRRSLRLHIWPREKAAAINGSVHNHGWSFTSVLLAGALTHELFAEGSGRRVPRYRYVAGSQERIVRCGESLIDLVSTEMIQEGQIYSVSSRQLHRVIPSSLVTSISLVSTFEREANSRVDVFLPFERELAGEVARVGDLLDAV